MVFVVVFDQTGKLMSDILFTLVSTNNSGVVLVNTHILHAFYTHAAYKKLHAAPPGIIMCTTQIITF